MHRPARRKLVAAAAVLLVAPRAAGAQRPARVARVGFLSPTAAGWRNEAFVQGLRDLGYAEGRNVAIEMRFANGRPERLPSLAGELVRLNVDVLVAGSTIGARAAKEATSTIPIVFAGSSDPVAGGLVTNLARPEGNVTGVSLAIGDGVASKWMELLKEAAPGLSHVAALWNPSNAAAAAYVRDVQSAARASGVRLEPHQAANAAELGDALGAIESSGAQGLIVIPSPFATTVVDRLVRFAAERRLPAMYFIEDFVDAGGLMSYGPSFADAYRRAAGYVDRILKGAKPRELPVEQPTTFSLVVNLRTAKALGLAVPKPILLRADRVVE